MLPPLTCAVLRYSHTLFAHCAGACRSSGYSGGNLPGVIPSGPIPDQNPGNGGRPRGL